MTTRPRPRTQPTCRPVFPSIADCLPIMRVVLQEEPGPVRTRPLLRMIRQRKNRFKAFDVLNYFLSTGSVGSVRTGGLGSGGNFGMVGIVSTGGVGNAGRVGIVTDGGFGNAGIDGIVIAGGFGTAGSTNVGIVGNVGRAGADIPGAARDTVRVAKARMRGMLRMKLLRYQD